MSLIHDYVDSLDYGHHVSYIFDSNTGIWCDCDDEKTTQITDLPKGVYIRESHQKKPKIKWCQAQQMYYLLFIIEQAIWQNTALFFSRIHQNVQNQAYEESNWRSEYL